MTDFRIGVDWRRKGFICLNARPGDALNVLPTPITHAAIAYKNHGGSTVSRNTISTQSQARCSRFGTQNAGAFSRNGHRPRQLVTTLGVLPFWLPRVVCECGGSVRIPFSILQPYQRIWEDVLQQIDRWAHLGLSLRQMQNEIGQQVSTQIGLRKLNETVHQVTSPPRLEFTHVPPVVMLDAIWITLLKDTGETRPDVTVHVSVRLAKQIRR